MLHEFPRSENLLNTRGNGYILPTPIPNLQWKLAERLALRKVFPACVGLQEDADAGDQKAGQEESN
jgi:hypothetical protein